MFDCGFLSLRLCLLAMQSASGWVLSDCLRSSQWRQYRYIRHARQANCACLVIIEAGCHTSVTSPAYRPPQHTVKWWKKKGFLDVYPHFVSLCGGGVISWTWIFLWTKNKKTLELEFVSSWVSSYRVCPTVSNILTKHCLLFHKLFYENLFLYFHCPDVGMWNGQITYNLCTSVMLVSADLGICTNHFILSAQFSWIWNWCTNGR